MAGHSADVSVPFRSTARGRGGAHHCTATTRFPEPTGAIFSKQSSARSSGGAQNKCVCEKKRVLEQTFSNVDVKIV